MKKNYNEDRNANTDIYTVMGNMINLGFSSSYKKSTAKAGCKKQPECNRLLCMLGNMFSALISL